MALFLGASLELGCFLAGVVISIQGSAVVEQVHSLSFLCLALSFSRVLFTGGSLKRIICVLKERETEKGEIEGGIRRETS